MDKRIEKTKRKLKTALIALLEKESLNDITVYALCQEAKVNRSTFYVHYSNVIECFDEIADDILSEMAQELVNAPKENVEVFMEVYFNAARKNQAVFRAIHATNIHNPMIKKMIKIAENIFTDVPLEEDYYRYNFLFSGIYGMVAAWLERDCRESNEELIRVIKSTQ